MRIVRIMVAALGLALLSTGMVVASDNYLGPVWNARSQTPVFMVHCYSGPCDIEIQIFDRNGNEVSSATFDDVPDDGTVFLPYGGFANPISAEFKDPSGSGEMTLLLLDAVTGKVDAIAESD